MELSELQAPDHDRDFENKVTSRESKLRSSWSLQNGKPGTVTQWYSGTVYTCRLQNKAYMTLIDDQNMFLNNLLSTDLHIIGLVDINRNKTIGPYKTAFCVCMYLLGKYSVISFNSRYTGKLILGFISW